VVEKTHLARLHYRCLSNLHARFHDFCLSLLSILSTLGPVQKAWPSTVTQNHSGTIYKQSRLFLSHQLFAISKCISRATWMESSRDFPFTGYFIVKELPALLQAVKYNGMYIICLVLGCLCINLSLA